MKNTKGFTLIELLLVIGIISVLAAIVLIAINPARQLAQARNAQRRSNINSILNAVHQYMIDNRGNIPPGITSTDKMIGNSCVTATCAAASPTTVSCVDLDSHLTTVYINSIPIDPGGPTGSSRSAGDTGYIVSNSATNNRITVTSCDAELSESITVTR